MRRLAFLVTLVFMAGPAIGAECFLSCWASAPVQTSEDSCHTPINDDGVRIDGVDECGDATSIGSPFVKTPIQTPIDLLAADDRSLPKPGQPFPALMPSSLRGAIPPDLRSVVPLRI